MAFRILQRLLISVYLLFSVEAAWASETKSYVFVSDIDDTLKVTNVRSYYDAIWNGFWGTGTFVGMKELYQELNVAAESLTYLSGSPQSLTETLKDLLIRQKGFPEGTFLLSNWFGWEKSYAFKLRSLMELSAKSKLPFLLVGDDTQADPEVYTDFIKAVPTPGVKAYIHKVVGRQIPDGMVSFVTAFDIALSEFEAKHLTSVQVAHVGQAILDSKQLDLLFPAFKACPADFSYSTHPIANSPDVQRDEVLLGMARNIEELIRKTCAKPFHLLTE